MGLKNIQAPGYNGACTVFNLYLEKEKNLTVILQLRDRYRADRQ